MAARVGTGVIGDNYGVTSFSSAGKDTTVGNLLVAIISHDNATISTITDSAGNSWSVLGTATFRTTGHGSLAYAYVTNDDGGSNVVTVNFSSTANYVEMIVEEFSGLATSSVLDGSAQTNSSDSDSDYTTANITTSTSGLVVMGVGDWDVVSAWSGTPGNPDFSAGANKASNAVCSFFYLISGSAQTVTPGGTASGGNGWGAIAQAFKDAGASQSNAPRAFHQLMRGIG